MTFKKTLMKSCLTETNLKWLFCSDLLYFFHELMTFFSGTGFFKKYAKVHRFFTKIFNISENVNIFVSYASPKMVEIVKIWTFFRHFFSLLKNRIIKKLKKRSVTKNHAIISWKCFMSIELILVKHFLLGMIWWTFFEWK